METEQPAFIFKLCLLGQGGVGKTCICKRLCFDTFDLNTKLTLGIDFFTYHVPVIIEGVESRITLSIWDFGGQSQFRKLFNYYISGVTGIFMVFSLIDFQTLNDLNWWYKELDKIGQKDTPKIIIGTKNDLVVDTADKIKVKDLIVNQFMKRQNERLYFKTSSKENQNVNLIFKEMTRIVLNENNFEYDKIL
jgi:small GTP-binding protein